MFDLPKYGDGVCLARLAELLEALSIDRARLQRNSVVVTGSNGKGSTAAFCAGIGRAYGLRTGLFTSPHLYRFNERFRSTANRSTTAHWRGWWRGRNCDRRGVATAQGKNSAHSRRSSRWHACIFRSSDAILRCSKPVSAAATILSVRRRAHDVRDIGRLRTRRTVGQFAGIDRSDKSDACVASGTIIYGENCRDLRDHIVEYNRHPDVEIYSFAIRSIAARKLPQRRSISIFVRRSRFPRWKRISLAEFQINNAAIAIALFVLWLRRRGSRNPRIDWSRGAVGPS